MTEMELVVYASETPNVVRLSIPVNHRDNDGAAWIYVPSVDTIYIGPPGSYGAGSTIDLATTIRSLADISKGDKLISGVLYDDGYSDIFQIPEDEELEFRLQDALENYWDMYYEGNGIFRGENGENGYENYPTEDDSSYDPEDEQDEQIHKPDLGGAEDDDSAWTWLKERKWNGMNSDYSVMKPTPGTSPIEGWSPEDHHAWFAKADVRRGRSGVSSWGSSREDLHHWRWSFGDNNLVQGAPHQGLWVWPTESGYPDHFSQTGSAGLGNCAQGRIYPHLDGTWEILTWPERPRNVHDPKTKLAIQQEAEAAVKDYIIKRIGVDPSKIFFTKMGYSAAVSNYHSESYPGYEWKSTKSYKSGPSGASHTPGTTYDTDPYGFDDDYGPMASGQLHFNEDGDASWNSTPVINGVQSEPGRSHHLLDKVIDKVKRGIHPHTENQIVPIEAEGMTPEEKWEATIKEWDDAQKATRNPMGQMQNKGINDEGYPEGESSDTKGDAKYNVIKRDGKTTVVSNEDYQRAVEEYGQYDWWRAFVSPGETLEQIKPTAAVGDSIHDFDPEEEMWRGYIDGVKSRGQPTGQGWSDKGPTKTVAFVWLGFGYGEDAGVGDPREAKIVTGTAHWNIVSQLIDSKENINDFLNNIKNGEYKIPMVWGYVTTHPNLKGIYVQFLTHIAGAKQDTDFYPQALEALATKFNKPVLDYDFEDSETPIMQTFPVSGKGEPNDGGSPPIPDIATAPTSDEAGQQGFGSRVINESQVGNVTVETYRLDNGFFETAIMGGDLDGHVYPSYSRSEADRIHRTIVDDEYQQQSHHTSAIIDYYDKKGGHKLALDFAPAWKWVFAHSSEISNLHANMKLAYSPPQLSEQLAHLGFTTLDGIIFGRIGTLNGNSIMVYDTLTPIDDIAAEMIEAAIKEHTGYEGALPWKQVESSIEAGGIHPSLLPQTGCFGFINGNLIIGRRHHQEIMYRLLQHGWTWDQLMNAPQVWGWFHNNTNSVQMWFSSDAGVMTSKKIKEECKAVMAKTFMKGINETNGYGGKQKGEYGGNIHAKYGDPTQGVDKMAGGKTAYDNTVISNLPDPPIDLTTLPVEEATIQTNILSSLFPPPKKVAARGVKYEGLDDLAVLRHVWQHHDFFEQMGEAYGVDGTDNDPMDDTEDMHEDVESPSDPELFVTSP